MKRKISILFISVFIVSCGSLKNLRMFKDEISVEKAIEKKELMDKSDNPAFKYLITEELREQLIKLEDVVVKDVTISGNIDYDFCIIVSVPSKMGEVECYIYATGGFYSKEDVNTVSKLVRGETRIDAIGEFSRFFTLLDETFTKIEIVKAKVDIKKS
ncbi:MAG: hypothetical protein SVZ03_04650 [Spirochaetota bacterium]|nr:hypothetical protein [Spirochaetota bacterium]